MKNCTVDKIPSVRFKLKKSAINRLQCRNYSRALVSPSDFLAHLLLVKKLLFANSLINKSTKFVKKHLANLVALLALYLSLG